MNKYCVTLLLLPALPIVTADSLETEIKHINNLLSSEKTLEARSKAEELLTVHPSSPALKYLLAFTLADEAEAAERSVRLALEVVSHPSVSSTLYCQAARLALTAAHNTDSEDLILLASQHVVTRDKERLLEEPDLRLFGFTLLGEQLLARGELERAEAELLGQDGPIPDVSLGLLLLLLLRLQERRRGDGDRSASQKLLLSLRPGDQQEMEDAKEMMKRIQDKWDKNRVKMSEEYDEMLEMLVEIGVYVSKYQRPGWLEAELEAKPLWELEQLGEAGEILRDIEAKWEVLRDEAERLVGSHHWSEERDLWTRGEKALEDSGRWQQLVLAGFGFPAPPPGLCQSAPELCSLAGSLYRRGGCPGGQIKLSVLAGATHLKPHCGLANTKLRAHLPLRVPSDPPPRLRVADQHLTWQEGKVIVFDDSFEHEVVHESNRTRIVLILDINHPDLSEEKRAWYEDHLEVEGYDVDGPRFHLNRNKIIDKNMNKKEEL